ncbi:MAG: uridine kinase [Halobacteriovoraceae bacterium]|nr:uridine kinase [Halobacteriovoraceae bacterium]|tara:strand:- start:1573 stop:2181 length:609 start_codon:yes stop_codon:yes gene_type:complete
MKTTKIIAIAGGSGSGKTFLSKQLYKLLGDEKSAILYQDNYYIDQSDKFDYDGGSVNFDHPESIDFDLLAKHISLLKRSEQVDIPQYDFATHKRKSQTLSCAPKEIIIIEGILVLSSSKVRALVDESIFVDTPEDIRYQRRLKRDIAERGRTEEGVHKQFYSQVKPMHDQFVEPSKQYAHFVIEGTRVENLNATLNRFESYC